MTTILISAGIIFVALFAARHDFRVSGRWYRTLAILLSGAMLLGFWLKPDLRTGTASKKYAVITDGAGEPDVENSDYESVFTLQDVHQIDKSDGREWLSSVTMLPDVVPAGSRVDLWGYGTAEPLPDEFEWSAWSGFEEKGLILNKAPHQMETGKAFEISMTVAGADPGDSLVVLKDGRPFLKESTDSAGRVSFTEYLQAEGPAHYLFEWVSDDSLINESWNLRGVQPQRLTVGILAYSPSFEVTNLAGQLGERGHQILQRTRVGADRFRYDAFQAETSDSESILSELDQFDLLMVDAREYEQLNQTEQQQIVRAVESGLDVMLLPPTADDAGDWAGVFSDLAGEPVKTEKLSRLQERRWQPESTAGAADPQSIPLLDIRFSEIPSRAETIYSFVDNSPVGIRLSRQYGTVSGHLFYQTYAWLLGGHAGEYHQFWSDYLSRIISRESGRLEVDETILRRHSRASITITALNRSSQGSVEITPAGHSMVELPVVWAKDHPGVGSAEYWPDQTGWHQVQYSGDSRWFYVYDEDAWPTDALYRTWRFTKTQLNSHETRAENSKTGNRPLPPDWIWIISFISLQAFLWIERKWV